MSLISWLSLLCVSFLCVFLLFRRVLLIPFSPLFLFSSFPLSHPFVSFLLLFPPFLLLVTPFSFLFFSFFFWYSFPRVVAFPLFHPLRFPRSGMWGVLEW